MTWEDVLKRVKCPACDKTFNTREEHDKHHKEAHPDLQYYDGDWVLGE